MHPKAWQSTAAIQVGTTPFFGVISARRGISRPPGRPPRDRDRHRLFRFRRLL